MRVPPQRFQQSASVVLNGSGDGQATIQCPPTKEWRVTRTTVLLSNPLPTNMPTVKLFLNFVSDSNFIDGTYAGALNSSDAAYDLPAGDSVIAVWEGGDAGLNATVRVSGMQYPIGQLERG